MAFIQIPKIISESDIKFYNFFTFIQRHIVDGVPFLQGSAVNSEKGKNSFLRMVNDLEGHGAKVLRRVVRQEAVLNLARRWKVADDGVEKRLNADVAVRAAAEGDDGLARGQHNSFDCLREVHAFLYLLIKLNTTKK